MEEQKYKLEAVSIFYSYAHEDEKLRKQLESHLSLLRQQGLITEWHNRRIDAGADWEQAIDTHLMSAFIILLLISPDFLASDYCYSIEMQQALERHQRNEARVIPILLRPTDWEDAPFAHLQYLPRNRKPVTKWSNRDEAFVEIAKSIRAIVTADDPPLEISSSSPVLPKLSTLSFSQQKDHSTRTIASNMPNECITIIHELIRSPRCSLNILAWFINLLVITILFLICRFIPYLSFIPLVGYMQQHQFPFLIFFCGVLLLTLIGSLTALQPTPCEQPLRPHQYFYSRRLISGISTLNLILCLSLLTILLLQPPWCPRTFCYPSTVVSKVVMNPTTILEADFLTFESNTFVIPDDPTRISPTEVPNATNPHSIGAVLMKDGRFSSVYSVVLTIHSLYQGRYNILIDQIALIVIDRPVTSSHLNVWANKSLVHYNTTRYGIAYHGEGSGTILPAKYLELPDGYTQLTHNETDHLAVQIISQTLVDLQFKIQITYHVATETKRYMLQLPEEGKGIFEVVFSNQSNWHPYRLQSGHLVASK